MAIESVLHFGPPGRSSDDPSNMTAAWSGGGVGWGSCLPSQHTWLLKECKLPTCFCVVLSRVVRK